jgi:hypothetical protein
MCFFYRFSPALLVNYLKNRNLYVILYLCKTLFLWIKGCSIVSVYAHRNPNEGVKHTERAVFAPIIAPTLRLTHV